jgi:nucleotide-binding universal stress UspA family protein
MRILVPIDGSPLSLAALRHVIALQGDGLRVELVLANVQAPASLYEWVRAPDPASLGEIAEAAGQHALQTAESLLREAGLDATELLVSGGDTAHALLDLIETEACDAVIMGSHGAGGLRAAFQGSVSQALIHAARVPVTLVRPPEPIEPADTADGADAAAEEDEAAGS